jgi:extracellular matrix protein 14
LDIWQVTPDHVDIYFPAPTSPSSSRIIAYPHSSTLIPIPPPSPPSYSQTQTKTNPPTNWTSLPPLFSPYHTSYHPLFEIDSFLYALEREHPELVEVFRVGISGEGRDLLGVRISKGGGGRRGVGKKAGGKMGFVITGAQHAREVSTSFFPMFRVVFPV